MNALTANFAFLTQTLAKFTAEPLVADFFEAQPEVARSVRMLNVAFDRTERLSDLRARIERFKAKEQRKSSIGHWSFSGNKLVAFDQILRAIDKYQEIAR